jgi:hypothetical protein
MQMERTRMLHRLEKSLSWDCQQTLKLSILVIIRRAGNILQEVKEMAFIKGWLEVGLSLVLVHLLAQDPPFP